MTPSTRPGAPVWAPEPSVIPPVVVLGDLMTDVVARMSTHLSVGSDTPCRISLHGGGSSANVAAWLSALGAPVAYIARVGADEYGRIAVDDLSRQGVFCQVARDPDLPTGTCLVLVSPDGERSMLPDAGANEFLTPTDIPRHLFRPGRHLHLSGYALLRERCRDAGLRALRLARDSRMTVSIDPASAAMLEAVGPDTFLRLTAGADLAVANREEAEILTGQRDPRAAAERLSEVYREAVVKCGALGAVWHGGFIGASAAAERVDVVDTTGAGDAFAAGFLAEWLPNPEPETALAAGNRVAAKVVGRVGARPSIEVPRSAGILQLPKHNQ